MALRKRGAEGEESEDLSVPLRVEAPESAAPRRTGRKRQGVKTKAPAPKKSKASSSATPATRVVEVKSFSCDFRLSFLSLYSEVLTCSCLDFQETTIPGLSEEEEVEEVEPLVTSRRRLAKAPTVDEPEPGAVEDSPVAVVANVLGDLEPGEATDVHPEAEGDDGDTQSFAFDTKGGEDLPTEVPVEQPVEVTQAKAVDTVDVTSPPRDQIMTSPPESSFQTPPTTQSSPRSTARFYERFVMRAARPPTGVWLCCSGHPFFADLPNTPPEQIAFFACSRKKEIFLRRQSSIGKQ